MGRAMIDWKRSKLFTVLFISLFCLNASDSLRADSPASFEKLKAFALPFPAPTPGSWQYEQNEPGQTFEQYKASKPTVATAKRSVIYVQILGRMSDSQKAVVEKTVQYLHLFYGLKTKLLEPLDASVVPISARRIHPLGQRQFNASYICEKVLAPRRPADAAAYIAFTAEDLYPADGWNFCFGYAMYNQRVGIWSVARNGDPSDPDQAPLALRRALRIASHEVGHMFSMRHCIAYKCNMNGVNSLEEADQTPLYLCPECLRKLNYATKVKYVPRWRALEKFYSQNGLAEEAEFMRRCLGM